MDSSSSLQENKTTTDEEQQQEEEESHFDGKYKEMMSTFPKGKDWNEHTQLYHYQGFWYMEFFMLGILSAQHHFKPQSTDIILATFMKTGTTWLKALTLSILTRHNSPNNNPLLQKGPHDCMPFMEVDHVQGKSSTVHQNFEIPLVGTHCPFTSLPESIVTSGCKIIYLWRDPKDVFVSLWFFFAKLYDLMGIKPRSLGESFELFCDGFVTYGPYWDHILGYWNAKLENPEKVLFLKYEEMMEDTSFYVKKIADFMGHSFSLEEEENGEVEKIVKMCSFENLRNLEVNKNGMHRENTRMSIGNNLFFRKGEIGDWKNYMTLEMGNRLDQIMKLKLIGSGLTI